MKISVITASFNALAGLKVMAEQLSQQSYSNIEWLVADGGSQDGTPQFLASSNSVVSWWVSSPDAGIFDAWNRAVDHATGDWIIFFGVGDGFVNRDSLERAVKHLHGLSEESLIAYGKVQLINLSGEKVQTIGSQWDPERFRSRNMTIPHQATFHRKEFFEYFGRFEVDRNGTSTYEMLLRYLKDHDAFYIDEIIANMELGGISTRPENHMRFLKAYIHAQKKHGTFSLNFGLVRDFGQALIKILLAKTIGTRSATKLVQLARQSVGLKAHY